jgi:hypothetical protein
LSGFFSVEDVRRYGTAIEEATRSLGGHPTRQRMLNDITGMQIQPQEVVAAFATFVADPRYSKRKVAFIVEASLARMQLNRVKVERYSRSFGTRAEAETWLFAEECAAA